MSDLGVDVLRGFSNALSVGMCLFHMEDRSDERSLRFVWCNEPASKIVGADMRPLFGKPIHEAFPNLEETGAIAVYSDVVRSGRAQRLGELEYGDELIARSVFEVAAHPLPQDHLGVEFRNVTASRRAADTIAQQAEALMELSAPAVEIWKGIVLVPLVGVLDTRRARIFTERLLQAIVDTESRVALVDVTGVPVIDTVVARHLLGAVRAAEMLGAKIVVTGIGPQTAVTVARQQIDTRGLNTAGSLKAGMAQALKMVAAGQGTQAGTR